MDFQTTLYRRLTGWSLLLGLLVAIALYSGYRNLRAGEEKALRTSIEDRIADLGRELDTTHALYVERCRASMRLLREVAFRRGAPSAGSMIQVADRTVPDLLFGGKSSAADFELVDYTVDVMGGTATLFTRAGDDFVRVSTNVQRTDGSRAVGTMLNPDGPAIAAIRRGSAYYGAVDILGRPYITGYEPVRNAEGEIIGITYVGYRIDTLGGISEQIANARLLEQGFFTLIDQNGKPLFQADHSSSKMVDAAIARASAGETRWTSGDWMWRAEHFPRWGFTILAAVNRDDLQQVSLSRILPVFGFMVPAITIVLVLGFIFARRLAHSLSETERLREEAHKLSLVASRTHNGVLITGPTGRIEWVNEGFTRITGYTAEEVFDRHPDDFLMGPDTSPETLVEKRRARQERRGFHLEILNYRKDGQPVWVLADGQPVIDDQGRVAHYLVVQTDITTRKRAEEELRAAREAAEDANRTKSAFLANMSHELRTPMNAIIGYSEMLIEDAEDGGYTDAIPDLKKIHSAGKHLLGLINDVLDISKIEAGKMTLYLEDTDVPSLVTEVAATIRPLVEKNQNSLVVECPADSGIIHADVTKVRQTLFNLLSNAAKFTHEGTITVTVAKESFNDRDCFAFRVSDTGIGMNEEQLGKLFQAFVQADASTTRKYGGTGLGLTISRKFCQMMGGDITVVSKQGQGTTFTAFIPIRVSDPSAQESLAPNAKPITATAPAGDAPLILVVDDDPAMVNLLNRTLLREGYRVTTASNGREALALAKELRPRLITLDVMMPSIDGWSVLASLKSDPVTHDIPVVMISIVDDKPLGYSLGAADYLTKPLDRRRLSEVLGRHAPHNAGRLALVIDDLPDNREVLVSALKEQGWEIIEAENGQVGLDLYAERHPSLILLDLMMPVMDGFEFLQKLRQREDGHTVPVVVVTAKELTPEERATLNLGVKNVIEKGAIDQAALLQEIRSRIASATH